MNSLPATDSRYDETTESEIDMNADLLRRLIRAIADGRINELERLGLSIINEENRLGHSKLSQELKEILDKSFSRKLTKGREYFHKQEFKELPSSKRGGDLLATFIERDALEHTMILPPETEKRFSRIEAEFSARERLSNHGLVYRRSILLHGPPGCGKSLGAKRLAWNTGLPLMKVRFDALISSFFGESATNLRTVFESAKERPCVLLFDECDFLARSRINSKDIGEVSRIVNTLLQLMEEFDAPGLLVATTNIESALDQAIFRRFDDVFEVPMPGHEERIKLLKITLSNIRFDSEINWHEISKKLDKSSAAMVVKVAQNAAKAIVLTGRNLVDEEALLGSISEL